MASPAVRLGEAPVTSALDKRAYRTLTLANDLRVLLASDPRSEIAAAALDVGVGSFNDPDELPGLAHFLEHMLFLGTAKYPDENDFAKFLSKHGGSSNAYTASEHTNYHFQVSMSPARAADCASSDSDATASFATSEDGEQETPPVGSIATDSPVPLSSMREVGGGDDALSEALARFSQFFVAPLFTESATDRELTAVDHEHAKNMLNDGWRLGRVEAVCGNPQHPRTRFSTGSRETLCDIPAKQGIDVRAALLAFHRKYYSSNLMHLCITGPQTLDRLQELAVKLFGDIENKHAPHPSLEYAAIAPITDVEMRRVVYAQTVKQRRSVEMSWPLPSLLPSFRDAGPASASSNCANSFDAAADLVSDLMGYEGKGSLTSYLKEQGWIESLCVGSGTRCHYGWFSCSVDLTTAGVEKVDEIVAIVYSYLRSIRDEGVCEWIHDEITTLRRNRFRFRSREDPFDLACSASAGMAFLRDTELLSGRGHNTRYDSSSVHRILDFLIPARMTLFLCGEFVEKHTKEQEPIYGAEYGVETISEARIDVWRKAVTNSKLKIRRPNPFIATDFSIVAKPLAPGAVVSRKPQRLLDTEKYELHFVPDQTYRRPHAEVAASFVTSDPLYTSLTSSLCIAMALSLLGDDLNELSYDAGAASLYYSVSSSSKGISVRVWGYNEKLDKFFATVLDRLASFRASPDRYRVIKDQYEMGYRNAAQRSPMSVATSQTVEYCQEMSWSSQEYLAVLEGGGVPLELVNKFLASLMPVARAVTFVSGNVTAEWALRIPKAIDACLGFEGLSSQSRMRMHVPRVVRLPEGVEIWARQTMPNKDEENSAIEVLYQVGEHSIEWVRTDASLEILVAIMKTPFFDELRTKQQLGYLVSLQLDCWKNVYGMSVNIQGKAATPAELRSHIDAFMISFRNSLCDMTREEFEKFVDAAVSIRSEPDLTFDEFTSRMEYEVFTSRQMHWGRQDREVQALKDVTKDSVISLFNDYILEGSPQRRVFTSCAYGSNHKMSDDDAAIRARGEIVQEVSNPSSFKSTSDFYRAQGSGIELSPS